MNGFVVFGLIVACALLVAMTTLLTRIAIDASEANHGINNQGTGMPTIVQRVISQDEIAQATAAELVEFRIWVVESFGAFAAHWNITLPMAPPVVITAPLATPDPGRQG